MLVMTVSLVTGEAFVSGAADSRNATQQKASGKSATRIFLQQRHRNLIGQGISLKINPMQDYQALAEPSSMGHNKPSCIY
jgi:hypothetical protein